MSKILVTSPSLPDYDEYIEEIKSIWESKHITNFGPQYHKFISLLKDRYDYKHIDLQCNGHMLLQNILSCIEPGEVITTPFTFVSTTLAIRNAGHTPVFCDINEDDYNIDVSKIESLITDKTVAIVPVHVFGSPCDVEKIQEIADQYHLKVIYDAAHAFNVKVNHKDIGTFGDASMFSLHATKVFNSIEGGMGVFKDESLLEESKIRSNFGQFQGEAIYNGVNSKFNEFQASMGIVNLKHLDRDILRRKQIVEYYDQEFIDVKELKLLKRKEGIDYNFAYYPIVLKGTYENKVPELMNYLEEHEIYARRYFYPAINDMKIFKTNEVTTVAHNIAQNIICLPLYSSLSDEEARRITKTIKEFFRYE